MTARPHFDTLAERCGVAASYVAYDGHEQRISDRTREALLAALGFDASTEALAAQALEAVEAELSPLGLLGVRVVRVGSRDLTHVQVRLWPGCSGRTQWRVELKIEDDGVRVLTGENEAHGGVLSLPVPGGLELAPGYHGLRVELLHGSEQLISTQDLIVVPHRCTQLHERIGARRSVGVWGHLYALHSQRSWGIGDLGDLRLLIDWAARVGLDFIGLNPLHATDNLSPEPSPYYPLSRIYRNPIYLDLEATAKRLGSTAAQAALRDSALQALRQQLQHLPRVEYAKVARAKTRAMQGLFDGSEAQRDADREFAAYRQREGKSLVDFTRFCALRERLQAQDVRYGDWRSWPAEYRDSSSAAVQAFAAEHASAVAFHAYCQFELDRQLRGCRQRCQNAGMALGLYGDLAVGDAPHAADVWARPDLYARGVSIGAPPDAYSASGQAWGLTPLNPLALRKDRYRSFASLVRHAFAHMGSLRIDHVMGLGGQFWVPEGASAIECGYVRFPLDDLIGIVALESRRAGALVVGEDLGVVPNGFRERMSDRAVLRSQVLYFERDDAGHFRSPARFAPDALVTAGTHDLPPVAGFWAARDLAVRRRAGNIQTDAALAEELAERERAKAALLSLLRQQALLAPEPEEPSIEEITAAVNLLLASTASRLVGIGLDDLLLERDALNTPGTYLPDPPNWTRKYNVAIEDLVTSPALFDQLLRIKQRARQP